jgi:hypothetical protein
MWGIFFFILLESTIYITGPAKFDILLKNRVTFDIWAYVLYIFIMEKNVPAMTYALEKSSNSNVCISGDVVNSLNRNCKFKHNLELE